MTSTQALGRLIAAMHRFPSGSSQQMLEEYAAGVSLALDGLAPAAWEINEMAKILYQTCEFRPMPSRYVEALKRIRASTQEPVAQIELQPASPGRPAVYRILRGDAAREVLSRPTPPAALPTRDEVAKYHRDLKARFGLDLSEVEA